MPPHLKLGLMWCFTSWVMPVAKTSGVGGVMVLGEQGTCYLQAQIVFEAWGLSSKLIEATMVVAALVAIDEWVRRVVYERDVVVEVWAWSDNLSAIRQLVEESLGEVGVDIMDRLVAEVGSLCFGVNWGWIPARHDTGAKDWLALANKAMDAREKEGAGGGGLKWRAPDVWLEGWSVFVMEGGNIVLNLKKYIMVVKTDQFKVVLEGKSYTTQVPQRTWTEMLTELKGGVKGWTKIQPLHTIDWGFSRAWSRYAQVGEWEVTKIDRDCPDCGMWCPSLREHQMHQCGEVRRRLLHWQVRIVEHIVFEGVKAYRVKHTWGGVKVENRDHVIHIVWCHPTMCAQVMEGATNNIDVWPVWLGLGPVSGTVKALRKQGVQSPSRLIYKVLTTLANTLHGDKSQDLCYTQINEMQFDFPPEWEVGSNTRVVFGWKEREAWSDLWVPAALIWVCASLIVDLAVSPIATV